jgi:hypothetical protein
MKIRDVDRIGEKQGSVGRPAGSPARFTVEGEHGWPKVQ